MNSRERVIKTLNHEVPDKVPIDFGGMRSTGIMAIAYNDLKKHLNITTGETRVYDIGQQLADIEKVFLDLFEVDVVDLMNSFVGIESGEWKHWKLKNGSEALINSSVILDKKGGDYFLCEKNGRCYAKMPQNSLYFDPINPKLEKISSKNDIKYLNLPLLKDEELLILEKKAKYLYENTEYAIMAGFGGNMLEGPQEIRGWMNYMEDLLTGENFVDELLDKFLENYLTNLKLFLQSVGNYVQLIQMGDDLGTQRGPIISPDLYRDKIKKRHTVLFNYIKNNSKAKVFLHSCGSIYKLIPDLIEAGVQVLNPIQTNAANMEPLKLKKEFGKEIVFWGGGCETQTVLLNGTMEEIRNQVRERLKIFASGGGYVFCQIHNIQAGIRSENIIEMFNAAKEYRNYPIPLN